MPRKNAAKQRVPLEKARKTTSAPGNRTAGASLISGPAGYGDGKVRSDIEIFPGVCLTPKQVKAMRAGAYRVDAKGKRKFGYDLAAREIMKVTLRCLCYQTSPETFSVRPSGQFRFWDGRRWAVYEESWMHRLVTRVFEGDVQTGGTRREILGHLSIHLGIERDRFDANGTVLFLEDCVLDPVSLVTRPHARGDFNTFVIPVRYDPLASCPRWKQCLDEWIGQRDENEKWVTDPGTILVIQEYVGYCLVVSCKLDKFLLLKGYGSNGKSVFIQAVADLLGPLAVQFAFSDFGDRFLTRNLEGKLLAYAPDEVGTVSARIDSRIKSFASGESLRNEKKFVQAHDFRNTAKGLWGCNNSPRFADYSHGNERRVMVVPFNRSFEKQDAGMKLDRDELLEALRREKPGILNWAIEGLQRLLKQGRFTTTAMVGTATAEVLQHHDPLREFLAECCAIRPGARTRFKTIYSGYMKWCDSKGVKSSARVSQREFSEEVRKREPAVTKRRVGPGLRLAGIRMT